MKIFLILLVIVLGLYGNQYFKESRQEPFVDELMSLDDVPTPQFNCDGRTYCSEMTSCAEASFFLQHCPGVKMDGNHDGIPCEQQWCK
jgi:excalibur calcium-binding domain-containing protein